MGIVLWVFKRFLRSASEWVTETVCEFFLRPVFRTSDKLIITAFRVALMQRWKLRIRMWPEYLNGRTVGYVNSIAVAYLGRPRVQSSARLPSTLNHGCCNVFLSTSRKIPAYYLKFGPKTLCHSPYNLFSVDYRTIWRHKDVTVDSCFRWAITEPARMRSLKQVVVDWRVTKSWPRRCRALGELGLFI